MKPLICCALCFVLYLGGATGATTPFYRQPTAQAAVHGQRQQQRPCDKPGEQQAHSTEQQGSSLESPQSTPHSTAMHTMQPTRLLPRQLFHEMSPGMQAAPSPQHRTSSPKHKKHKPPKPAPPHHHHPPSPSPSSMHASPPSPLAFLQPPGPPALVPPEPGMLALPYYKTWYFPGPSPSNYSQPFNLTLPGGPMQYFYEEESGQSRQPQHRIVFGPVPKMPSVLLMQATINIGGNATNLGTQGALFLHQQLYYNGGAELGWVYFCPTRLLARYVCGNCNVFPGQRFTSRGLTGVSYLGRQMSFRLGYNESTRMTAAQVYEPGQPETKLYDQSEAWPDWFVYNKTAPWYVTITWQRAEDGDSITGSNTNSTLWYLP